MSARIGDLLLGDGLIVDDDIGEALRVASERRSRFASALISMGRLSIDAAARALAAQHGMHAALEKHLDARDLALASLIPASLAWELCALPIALQRSGALVVCLRDPSPHAKERLEAASGRTVVLAITPEIALLPRIDETYPARASSEPGMSMDIDVDMDVDVDLDGSSGELDLAKFQLVDLDDQRVSKNHDLSSSLMRPATPVATITMSTSRPTRSTGPLPARLLARDPAHDALGTADTTDQVVDILIAFLRHRFDVGVVIGTHGDLALGLAGFGGEAHEEEIASLAVPLGQPSVLRIAHERTTSFVGEPLPGSAAQDRFFRLFGPTMPAKVCVVPIVIGDRVVQLLYGHAPRACTVEDAARELETLAVDAGAALDRIQRAG